MCGVKFLGHGIRLHSVLGLRRCSLGTPTNLHAFWNAKEEWILIERTREEFETIFLVKQIKKKQYKNTSIDVDTKTYNGLV